MSRRRDGLKPEHVLLYVVRPTLRALNMHGRAAEQLLMGTAAQESHFRYLSQLGLGPALGLFQMEPATHDDIWAHYIRYRPEVADPVRRLAAPVGHGHPSSSELSWNLRYAAAMARVHYRRVPAPLPDAGDVEGLAFYWKEFYNTAAGAGTPDEFITNWVAFDLDRLWA